MGMIMVVWVCNTTLSIVNVAFKQGFKKRIHFASVEGFYPAYYNVFLSLTSTFVNLSKTESRFCAGYSLFARSAICRETLELSVK